jgi:transcriptional regulator with XRE-family HTH domain
MTPAYIGHSLATLRRRCRLRQRDLGAQVGITQGAVSRAESGDLDAISLRTLQRMFEEVGGELVLNVRYRGGELDRLMDRAHAGLVEQTARRLARLGWEVHVEVSYSEFGERGSIDILAWHPARRIVLVVEVKSEITAVEETLRRHDVKVRLAPKVIRDRLGVQPAATARLLVLPSTSMARRRLAEHAATFALAYPARGRGVRSWLRDPVGPLAGILFEPVPESARAALRRRVRVTGKAA